MTNLYDLLDPNELRDMMEEKRIAKKVHPSLPISIYNYSNRAQFMNKWTKSERVCRGLIIEDGTNEVIARGMTKFFNYGQPGAPDVPLDTMVCITTKHDGCFIGTTMVNLWDGGTKSIRDIVDNKLEVMVIGTDPSGKLVPSRVVNWFDHGFKEDWLDISVSSRISPTERSFHGNKIVTTPNHFWHVNNTYIPASEINVGDSLISFELEPDSQTLHYIRSSLLGDGSISVSNAKDRKSRFAEGHKIEHEQYVVDMRKALGTTGVSRNDTLSGYGSKMTWLGTKTYKKLNDLRDEWYPNGKKSLPDDLNWIDDFTVAKWYMDDGCRAHSEYQNDRAIFSTNAFSEVDVRRLADVLSTRYGVSTTPHDNKGWCIRINYSDASIDRFWNAIAPYIHDCFKYKLPERYREVEYIGVKLGREIKIPVESTVIGVSKHVHKPTYKSSRAYDIGTETENYMVKGVLVHNSLGIGWTYDGCTGVATRGSFTSEQAKFAMEIMDEPAETGLDYTPIYEIVAPFNRIVLDYGDLKKNIPLGRVDNATGLVSTRPSDIVKNKMSLGDALRLPIPDDEEGYVLDILDDSGQVTGHVKLKGESYKILHGLLTNTNARRIWVQLAARACHHWIEKDEDWARLLQWNPEDFKRVDVEKDIVDTLLTNVPDEFYDWVTKKIDAINDTVSDLVIQAIMLGGQISMLDDKRARYEAVKDHPLCREILSFVESRDDAKIIVKAWQLAKPEGDDTPFATSED